jgi:P-type conjugative transfer protein TrbJ
MKNTLQKITFLLTILLSLTSYADMPVIDFSALIQLGDQLEQLREQTKYIQQQLQNLTSGQYKWSNAQGIINNLGSIVNKTNTIAYNASNLNQKFQKSFPGYEVSSNFKELYKNNINMTQNTLNAVLQSMGANAKNFQSENERLSFLQRQSQNARGQTQAIQAGSQIASEMVSQIQMLRQTIIAQTNAQTAFYATQLQTQASARAELERIISNGSTETPEYGSSGNYLTIPDFPDFQ